MSTGAFPTTKTPTLPQIKGEEFQYHPMTTMPRFNKANSYHILKDAPDNDKVRRLLIRTQSARTVDEGRKEESQESRDDAVLCEQQTAARSGSRRLSSLGRSNRTRASFRVILNPDKYTALTKD